LFRWSVEMGFFFGRPRARSVDSRSSRPPPPILRTPDQLGSLCIALDVPAENVEMAIILDWETLESALVNMSLARCVVVGVVPHRLRQVTQRKKLLIPPSSVDWSTKCQ